MPFSPKVLIIEDDELIVFLLKAAYEFLGCQVLATLDSGEAAVDFLKTTTVDLISMDILLSTNMTGIDAMNRARAIGVNTPVIFVSASNDFEAKAKAFTNALFLRKPVGLDELAMAVQFFFPQAAAA